MLPHPTTLVYSHPCDGPTGSLLIYSLSLTPFKRGSWAGVPGRGETGDGVAGSLGATVLRAANHSALVVAV
jgi:hypothetical protein